MTQLTVEISNELEQRLRPVENELPRILEMGLRELYAAGQFGFHGTAELLEFLASLPTPDEILALRPSPALQARINELIEKSEASGLTAAEEQEWEQYQYLEQLVRLAKIQARARLNAAPAT
jgi:hypothetical protein